MQEQRAMTCASKLERELRQCQIELEEAANLLRPTLSGMASIYDSAAARVRAALVSEGQPSPAQGVPEGWQLVPVEPTEEMTRAGEDTFVHTELPGTSILTDADSGTCYRAMLAVAPAPLSSAQQQRQE